MNVEIELKHGIKKKLYNVRTIEQWSDSVHFTYKGKVRNTELHSVLLPLVKEIKIYGDK